MKIALLFSGQIREIDPELFNKSLKIFIGEHTADIFASTWSHSGISMEHNPALIQRRVKSINVVDYIKFAFNGLNLKKIDIHSFSDWESSLPEPYRLINSSRGFSDLTRHSLPQIYQIYKSFCMLGDKCHEYDLIVRLRYDSFFTAEFSPSSISHDTVYNINFGRAYYPQRIYDIFFYGSPSTIKHVFNAWLYLPDLVKDPFNNGLDERDACRILYLAARKFERKVESTQVRYTDIYRPKKGISGYLEWIIFCGFCDNNSCKKTEKIFIKYCYKTMGYTLTTLIIIANSLNYRKYIEMLSMFSKKYKFLHGIKLYLVDKIFRK